MMRTEKIIRLLAGSMVIISLVLGHLISPWWQLLALFVGANLVQSVFTGICPAEMILKSLGVKQGCCSGRDSCCNGHDKEHCKEHGEKHGKEEGSCKNESQKTCCDGH